MFLKEMSTIVRISGVFMNRSLKDTDINYSENFILMYLFGKENVSQDIISDYYCIDKGSISKTINGLVEKGYVSKQLNQNNRRENFINLTELGKKTFSRNKHLLDEWHRNILKNITPEEISTVSKILSKMAINAKEAIEENK